MPKISQHKTTARRKSREFALQCIYSWLITDSYGSKNFSEVVFDLLEENNFKYADKEWFDVIVTGVLQKHENLRDKITPYLDRPLWSISPVEHAILLIGSFELLEHVEIPYRVIINESIELAKSFGGTDGFKFVNGILDKMASHVRNN